MRDASEPSAEALGRVSAPRRRARASERAWRLISAASRKRDRRHPARARPRAPGPAGGDGDRALVASTSAPRAPRFATGLRMPWTSGSRAREPRADLAALRWPHPVDSPEGTVGRPGGRLQRLLGDYREATWSPRGCYVAAHHRATSRWARRSGRARSAGRSPAGVRSAPRAGTPARLPHRLPRAAIRPRSDRRRRHRRPAASTPGGGHRAGRRPGAAHVLAFAAPDGSVHAVAVDTARRSRHWTTRAGAGGTRRSADGRRLIVASRSGAEVLDPTRGTAVEQFGAPGEHPDPARRRTRGPRLRSDCDPGARLRRAPALVLVGMRSGARRLFVGPGIFSGLAFSPDGKWLLLAWRSADQWVFLQPGGRQRIVAVSNISSQFSPGGVGPTGFPRLAGWCCAR